MSTSMQGTLSIACIVDGKKFFGKYLYEYDVRLNTDNKKKIIEAIQAFSERDSIAMSEKRAEWFQAYVISMQKNSDTGFWRVKIVDPYLD